MRAALSLSLLSAALLACGPSEAQLEALAAGPEGAARTSAVLRSSRVSARVRERAALQLLTLEHPDGDGLPLLLRDLDALAPGTREALVEGLSVQVAARLGAAGVASGLEARRAQLRLVDGACRLMPRALASRPVLARAVVRWYLEDLSEREELGLCGLGGALVAGGGDAWAPVLERFEAEPGRSRDLALLVRDGGLLASYLARLGGAQQRARARTAVVARARWLAQPAASASLEELVNARLAHDAPRFNPRMQRLRELVRMQLLVALLDAAHALAPEAAGPLAQELASTEGLEAMVLEALRRWTPLGPGELRGPQRVRSSAM